MGLMFLSRKRNKRSRINLNHVKAFTLAPGNLVPASFVRVFKGDEVDFSPSLFAQAMPMNAPLVNGFKMCLEYFFVPDRLYNFHLLTNEMGVTDGPSDVKFPKVTAPSINLPASGGAWGLELRLGNSSSTPENAGNWNIVAPGSLADCMGLPVGMYPTFSSENDNNSFNALRMLGYLDVIYNYYVNQQISTIPTALLDYGANNYPDYVPVSYETSEIFDFLQAVKSSVHPETAIASWQSRVTRPTKGRFSLGSWSWLCSRASIFQRSLPPYYLESWLATAGYDSSEIIVDDESNGKSISFRNIAAASHVQRWMDLALGGGSRYTDYENSQFDVGSLKNNMCPMYLGSDRQYLGSKVLYQTTGFGDSASPLGSFAGQAAGGERFKRRRFRFQETGHFMVIASLVPDVIYNRGIDPFLREMSLADVYAPALDNIAMQPLLVEELNAIADLASGSVDFDDATKSINLQLNPVGNLANTGVGYVPAWSHVMQVVSRSHGLMTTELKYWLLNRVYGSDVSSKTAAAREGVQAMLTDVVGTLSYADVEQIVAFLDQLTAESRYTPYVLSDRYNDVFADTSPTAQNFVLTLTCNMSAMRDKSKVNVPTTL